MTIHAVRESDLEAALVAARREAARILDQVNMIQQQLASTTFVGEQAEALAGEMNQKMSVFVAGTYDNLDDLLRLIVNNMNVVVTKLGGVPWLHQAVPRGQAVQASTLRVSGNADYEVDTDQLNSFADRVDGWFEEMVASYRTIQSTVDSGTPGWRGPEKAATVAAVNGAIDVAVGAPGGAGVRGVGSSLSDRLRQQAATMAVGG